MFVFGLIQIAPALQQSLICSSWLLPCSLRLLFVGADYTTRQGTPYPVDHKDRDWVKVPYTHILVIIIYKKQLMYETINECLV
jgi:hypothetical protein